MFNLREYSTEGNIDLLSKEIRIFEVLPEGSGYSLKLGDEKIHVDSLNECLEKIGSGVTELKQQIWDTWKELGNIAEEIISEKGINYGTLDNLLFLNSVKKSHLFSLLFDELKPIAKALHRLLNVDITTVDNDNVVSFNAIYLRIRLIHHLLMREIYRANLIHRYVTVTKKAQISGPWANLDLPMRERVWEYSEDEEYFAERQQARREQARYNPEYNKNGFYFVWQDLSTHPYSFSDREKDSPYKSRGILTIP